MDRLELYKQLADAEVVPGPAGAILASVNPTHAPIGALAAPTGGVPSIRAGEAWLRDRGCIAAQGPLEVATWFPYRANLGPHDEPTFWGEPTAPPEPWIEAGYREVARYASSVCGNADAIRYGESKAPKGVTLRVLEDFEASLLAIHRIVTASFEEAYAYSPLPFQAMAAMYRPLQEHIVNELVLFAESDGEPVGFVFGLPDLTNPGSGRFLVKTLAVRPEERRGGLGAWLVGELHRQAAGLGYDRGIHALMWAGSRSRNISAHGGRVFREYALFFREL
ncbi:MAG: GNAT family N-acetyltransferase [Proteobacteria bacterium]|nr:GNAT family N-acetyltransferase [Pseudomonadota bacterium]